MEYIFEFNICTDGDFSFQFVPCGTKRYVDETYEFKKYYEDRDEAIKDVANICAFLKEQIYTSRDYVREDWNRHIDNFVERLYASNEIVHEYVEERMYGNYDGTEFIFRAQPHTYNFSLSLTDEEFELIRKNSKLVTIREVKEAVLPLFRQ